MLEDEQPAGGPKPTNCFDLLRNSAALAALQLNKGLGASLAGAQPFYHSALA